MSTSSSKPSLTTTIRRIAASSRKTKILLTICAPWLWSLALLPVWAAAPMLILSLASVFFFYHRVLSTVKVKQKSAPPKLSHHSQAFSQSITLSPNVISKAQEDIRAVIQTTQMSAEQLSNSFRSMAVLHERQHDLSMNLLHEITVETEISAIQAKVVKALVSIKALGSEAHEHLNSVVINLQSHDITTQRLTQIADVELNTNRDLESESSTDSRSFQKPTSQTFDVRAIRPREVELF
jgi:hypothetical protein